MKKKTIKLVCMDIDNCLEKGSSMLSPIEDYSYFRHYNENVLMFEPTGLFFFPKYFFLSDMPQPYVDKECRDIGIVKEAGFSSWPLHICENGGCFYDSISNRIEICSPKVSRLGGIKKVLRKNSDRLAELAVIADTPDDCPALEKAGFPACTVGADSDTRSFVLMKDGYVSDSSGAKGVADIMRKIRQRNIEVYGL